MIKNFIADIPFFIALLFKNISNLFFDFSFKLHKTFKTEAGIKMQKYEKALNKFVANYKQTGSITKASGDSKLADILGVTDAGKTKS